MRVSENIPELEGEKNEINKTHQTPTKEERKKEEITNSHLCVCGRVCVCVRVRVSCELSLPGPYVSSLQIFRSHA